MADSWYFKNGKIVISHDDAEPIFQGYHPCCIFKLKFYNTCALERHVLNHSAQFCGDRSCHSRDTWIFCNPFFLAKC